MLKTVSPKGEVYNLEELEERLVRERQRHKFLVEGFLRRSDLTPPYAIEPILEYSRRVLEKWENPINFILPSDCRKADRLRAEANKLFRRKQYTDAIAKFYEAMEYNPRDHLSATNVALCHARNGECELAFERLLYAIGLKPAHCKAWQILSHTCETLRRVVVATFAFRMAHLLTKRQYGASDRRTKKTAKAVANYKKRSKASKRQKAHILRMAKGQLSTEEMSRDRTFVCRNEAMRFQCFGQMCLGELTVGRLPTRKKLVWIVIWHSTDTFYNLDTPQTEDRSDALKCKFGRKYAASVCDPKYLTYSHRVDATAMKRVFGLGVCNLRNGELLKSAWVCGVPDFFTVANCIHETVLAPIPPNSACVPSVVSIHSQLDFQLNDLRLELRKRGLQNIALIPGRKKERDKGWEHTIY